MDRWNCGNMVLVPLWHCPSSALGSCRTRHSNFWLTGLPKDSIIRTYRQTGAWDGLQDI